MRDQTNDYSDKQCFQQMEKSEKFKNGRQTKGCNLHNCMSHSNQKCFQQKNVLWPGCVLGLIWVDRSDFLGFHCVIRMVPRGSVSIDRDIS